MTPSSGTPQIRISAARHAQYDATCDDLIERALAHHNAFHNAETLDRWKAVRHRDALSVYKDRHHRNSKASRMMCSGLIPGTLDELLDGMYSATTADMRIVKSILTTNLLDCAMVHVCATQAPVLFAGIKWFAVKVPTRGALVHDRDALTYERMGRFIDSSGQLFAYHVIQSIDLPEWSPPGADERNGHRRRRLTRATTSACYLFRRVSADWIGCFMVGDFDAGGRVAAIVSEFLAADKFLSEGRILEVAHAKQFSFLLATCCRANTSSRNNYCGVCFARPSFPLFPLVMASAARSSITTTTEHDLKHCAGCWRRVCRTCRQQRVVFQLNARTRRPERAHFCQVCIDRVVKRQTATTDSTDDACLPQRKSDSNSSSNSSSAPLPVDRHFYNSPRGSLTLTPASSTHSFAWPSSFEDSVPDDAIDSDWTRHAAAADAAAVDAVAATDAITTNGIAWNKAELARLVVRFKSTRKSKWTLNGRSTARLSTPTELLQSSASATQRSNGNETSFASSNSSSSNASAQSAPAASSSTTATRRQRLQHRSQSNGTDAIFAQYAVQSHSPLWSPSPLLEPLNQQYDVEERSDDSSDDTDDDPEAAFEAFQAAAAQTRRPVTSRPLPLTAARAICIDELD